MQRFILNSRFLLRPPLAVRLCDVHVKENDLFFTKLICKSTVCESKASTIRCARFFCK